MDLYKEMKIDGRANHLEKLLKSTEGLRRIVRAETYLKRTDLKEMAHPWRHFFKRLKEGYGNERAGYRWVY